MMESQVKLPDMGEGVESATVAAILVSEGDEVEKDQNILELETEKAVAQMPSPEAGRVKTVHVDTQQEVSIGDLILTLEVEGKQEQEQEQEQEADGAEEAEQAAEGEQQKKGKQEQPEDAEPEEEDADEAEEDTAAHDDAGADETETAKSERDRQTEEADEDDSGATEPPPAESDKDESEKTPPEARSGTAPSSIPAAPATRELARELGVRLETVKGSGKDGWITTGDVKQAAEGAVAEVTPEPGRERDDWGVIRREKLASIRKTIARRMRESKDAAAHVTHFDDADVTDLEAFRQEHLDDFEGTEFTPLPFVVRAAVNALKDHPELNASLDLDRGEIIFKEYYGVGIAVATERGLIVPVLRDAETLSVFETAQEIERLSRKIRDGDFKLQDLKGGTFSISNLGAIGGRYATPIINHPESAVLLPGRARKMPVVREADQVEVRLMLPLSLTYDHRLVDGATAQHFLNDVKRYLEDPGRLLVR